MQAELQQELSRRLFAHLDAGTTDVWPDVVRQPVSAYTCPDRAERERRELFQRRPLFVGLSGLLPNPGDWITSDETGIPVLIVRGRDGRLRAFANVCRHRGAKLAEGRGCGAASFTCPYHGWTYDLDGRLIGLPDERNFPGVERADHRLAAVPVGETHGMVFVQATPGDGFDVDALLEGMGAEFMPYELGGWTPYSRQRFEFSMNWKIAVDTFLEPYHFPFLHKNTVGPIFIGNLCLYDGFGPHLREVLPRHGLRDMREKAPEDWDLVDNSALVYVFFPNTAFIVQKDHMEVWRCFPKNGGSPGESVVIFDFYIPEPVRSEKARIHWDKNVDLAVRTVIEEDFPTGETIQAGFAAGVNAHVTIGRNEPAVAHFETTVNRYAAA